MTTDHPKAREWVRPLAGYVCILPIAEERTGDESADGGLGINLRLSESGRLALPDIVDNEPIEGVVIAIGEGSGEPISNRLAAALAKDAVARLYDSDAPVVVYSDDEAEAMMAARFQEIAATIKVPFDVKIGDKCLWEPWRATTVILGEMEYNVVPEEAIVGLVE